jgi:hypothetical protein
MWMREKTVKNKKENKRRDGNMKEEERMRG